MGMPSAQRCEPGKSTPLAGGAKAQKQHPGLRVRGGAGGRKVLLLDEITVDMDVVGRLDLLAFFREECEERGATILYATHIFDGLEPWLTHIAYISEGALLKGAPYPSSADSCCTLLTTAVMGLIAVFFSGFLLS